jgi:hypothetical protein
MLPGKPEMWKKARMRFEALMKENGKSVGQNEAVQKWLQTGQGG